MGEILGIGTTHYPGLTATDEGMCSLWQTIINAPLGDDDWQDEANWPEGMAEEIGDDKGVASAALYRERMWTNFRKQREIIDDFAPDFIVVIADDQYENFKEDIIPPFCVFGLDDEFDQQVWSTGPLSKIGNYWGEPNDHEVRLRGHREGAKFITAGLLERNIAMPYAYKMLHSPTLAHGFNYTALFLDVDRQGFDHPIVPLHVNCYGKMVIKADGAFSHLFKPLDDGSELPDPPGPNPGMCHEVGARLAEVLSESPYRSVVMASSSWSHCFLSPNSGYVVPDYEADRAMLKALRSGDYDYWRNRTTAEVEASGHHELLNWHVLIGAMDQLDRSAEILDYVETFIFQSNKCFALFPSE